MPGVVRRRGAHHHLKSSQRLPAHARLTASREAARKPLLPRLRTERREWAWSGGVLGATPPGGHTQHRGARPLSGLPATPKQAGSGRCFLQAGCACRLRFPVGGSGSRALSSALALEAQDGELSPPLSDLLILPLLQSPSMGDPLNIPSILKYGADTTQRTLFRALATPPPPFYTSPAQIFISLTPGS